MTQDEKISRSKADLLDVPEYVVTAECGEKLVALTRQNIVLAPIWENGIDIEADLYRSYIKSNAHYDAIFVREEVARMLGKAAEYVPKNWNIVVVAGHRPVQVQSQLYQYFFEKIKSEQPSLSLDAVAQKARTYVADPSRKVSPHCCGSAIDIHAVDTEANVPIDFGTAINDESPKSHLHSQDITTEQYSNRMILLNALLKAGFASLESEWWHYSYGDQNWAAFYQKSQAIYDAIEVHGNA